MVESALKTEKKIVVRLESSILKTLAYFEIFSYPLPASELREFCGQKSTDEELRVVIKNLLTADCVFELNEFYSLQNDLSIAENRRKGNERAAQVFPKAFRIGRFLYKFPFVRGVAISGSLSKNFADKNGDID